MITYPELGKVGRFGNQLFEIAALVGIAHDNNQNWFIPQWGYAQYFKGPFYTGYTGTIQAPKNLKEPYFHHEQLSLDPIDDYNLKGYRQSEKYWLNAVGQVREMFTFTEALREKVARPIIGIWDRPTIAISVRRGDFVGNPHYYQLPVSYYYLALLHEFPDWQQYNILFFSDDIDYCQVHFEGVPNVYFAEGLNDVEQLCLMSMCDHFIISNSTFSWWGAYLGEKEGSKVVRPNYLFRGPTLGLNITSDYWPKRWIVFDHVGRRLDLKDVTFTIPVFIDHAHRMQNLSLCVNMLRNDLDTNITICEQGSHQANVGGVKYMRHDSKYFHRTAMLNDMARDADTPFVVNWDCDVFVPAFQLWIAAERLRNGDDMVYPFDGRFARVPRAWYERVKASMDLGIFGATVFTGKNNKPMPTTSVGGAIFFNKESFFAGGGENEYMLSFGPEDWERNYRFNALGYSVSRVGGSLYHLDHWVGPNSSTRNPFFKHNHRELDKVRAMAPADLERYVESWPWRSLLVS